MRGGVEAADDPPVDDAGAAVAEKEDIAGVDVGVKRPVAERGNEPRAHELLEERPRLQPERGDAGDVVDRNPVQVVHREDALPRELRERRRDDDHREAEARDQTAVMLHRARLVAEVELFRELLAEAVEHAHELPGLRHADAERQEVEERPHETQVGRDDRLDVGP